MYALIWLSGSSSFSSPLVSRCPCHFGCLFLEVVDLHVNNDAGAMALLCELPLEMLTHVCEHLDLKDLIRVSATCKRFRYGGLETLELPTESPVVAVLCKHAFPRPELIPSVRHQLHRGVVGDVPGPLRAAAPRPGGAACSGGVEA
jgi:hypothetical protein